MVGSTLLGLLGVETISQLEDPQPVWEVMRVAGLVWLVGVWLAIAWRAPQLCQDERN